MVTSATTLTRSGLSDWLIQRVSAVILAAYTVFIVGYLAANSGLEYEQWVALHRHTAMRFFNLLAILSIGAHAWIGLWSVLTDYVTERLMGPKATPLRLLLQLGMIGVCVAYVYWAFAILWGI